MKTTLAAKIALLTLLIASLVTSVGCDAAIGGAEVCIEGVISMTGKPISGLPSENVNIILKVPVKKITISAVGEETVITLSPSDASIVIGPDGISIVGVDPDEIEMEWPTVE